MKLFSILFSAVMAIDSTLLMLMMNQQARFGKGVKILQLTISK